jgi:outer membrane receptor for Fe3+-dicitrate
VTDLGLERDFSFGQNGTLTGFLEIKNLFNQRDNVIFNGSGFEFSYMQYGLQTRPPDDADYLKYGNVDEYNLVYGASQVNNVHNTYRYFDLVDNPLALGEPRLIAFGARMRF